MMPYLSEEIFANAVNELAILDRDLARIIDTLGPPPFFVREPGFPTLILLILEQQVSLASAKAAFDKLAALVGEITPASVLSLDDETLRGIGFSRQKARYSRVLAQAVLTEELALTRLHEASGTEVQKALTALTGIGPWTADVYLLMCLRRPDIWPGGDLAIQVAVQEIKGLAKRPTAAETLPHAEAWRPWRAVAARILWHYYLTGRKKG
jgi:DNA-3-methyladenine glycosylase II